MVSASSVLTHISSLYYEQRDGVTLGSSFLGNSRFWSSGQKAGVVGTYLCCMSRLWPLSGPNDRRTQTEESKGVGPHPVWTAALLMKEIPPAQHFGSYMLMLWVHLGFGV